MTPSRIPRLATRQTSRPTQTQFSVPNPSVSPLTPLSTPERTVAAMAQPHMPARGHSTAPTFDTSQPHELRVYFREIEQLFDQCSITAFAEKRVHILQYLNITMAELWEGLTKYSVTTTDVYDKWKTAIVRLYLGTEED